MITLNASGSSVIFTFDGNSTYLNDGTITVPKNSLALIVDESDMATFRKAASNDIFVSANIAEFGMTKDELMAWYKANMVSSSGGGGGVTPEEVEEMIDEAVSGKQDTLIASDGINIDSANTISAVYRGYVTMNPQYSVENYSGQLYIANIGNDIIDTFWTAEQSWDYAYFFSFDFAAKTYSITSAPQGRENDWQNYFTIEFDEDVQMFKVTTIQEVTYINSGGLSNILRIGSEYNDYSVLYSGATSDALDNIFNALDGKQDTLSAGTGISISGNVISATGGGGTDAPISAGTGTDSIKENYVNNVASGSYSHAEGQATKAYGTYSHAEGHQTSASGSSSHAEGELTNANGMYSHAEGTSTKANNAAAHAEGRSTTASGKYAHAEGILTVASGQSAHAEGNNTRANGMYAHAEGDNTIANNESEHASGKYNVSNTGESTSAQTLFSVGNGGWDETAQDIVRHNAFEIRQNGDIYIASGNTDIKLQDALGQGGGCEVEETVVYDRLKQEYFNSDGSKGKITHTIIDYLGDKTTAENIGIFFEVGDDSSAYGGWLYFDYINHSANIETLPNYVTAEYINDIQDFKVSIASAYQSTWWIKSIQGLSEYPTNALIPFYTINSGSPCTVISTDVVGLLTKVKDKAYEAVNSLELLSSEDDMHINVYHIDGRNDLYKIKLEELDGSNNKLKPNIQVPLGTSGWTAINIGDTHNCSTSKPGEIGASVYRIAYSYDEQNIDYSNLSISFQIQLKKHGSQWYNEIQYIDFVESGSTYVPSIRNQIFVGFEPTLEWDGTTKKLIVTYPATYIHPNDQYNIGTYDVVVESIDSTACMMGSQDLISGIEYYAEQTQPLKPYVQETRAALGGLSLVKLTKAEYDALAPNYDSNTLYVVIPNP